MKNFDLVGIYGAISNLDKRELNNDKIRLLRKVRLLLKDKLDEFNEVRKEIFSRYGIDKDEDIEVVKKADAAKWDECSKAIRDLEEETVSIATEPFLKEWEVLNISKNHNEFIVDCLLELLMIKPEVKKEEA